MARMLPTMKERKRYILFKIYSNSEVERREVYEQCTKACLQFLGELGCAKAGIQFLPETWNMKNQTGIIRVGHKYTDAVKAALALVKEINGKKAAFNSLLTSGSLSKLKSKQKEVK